MLNASSGQALTSVLRFVAAISAFVMLTGFGEETLQPGHPDLQEWLLPEAPPSPKDNATTPERVELGKMLFFDPRLSGDGTISCASCHSPLFGWSDGLPTGVGFKGKVLERASPTVINTGYNRIQMWDGRARTLEDQAIGPMRAEVEMNTDLSLVIGWLESNPGYRQAFAKAYPGEPISEDTVAKAIAAFERTIVSNNSPFDRWVRGESDAMTAAQVRGFRVFMNPEKGNCEVCHSAPNFTDDGFHNLGLASQADEDADMGRFEHIPIAVLKGAFKTPTLRNVAETAPYFHDGSARTLEEVIAHYERGGDVHDNLSPNMKPLTLTQQDKDDLVAFLQALTSPAEKFVMPQLPPGLLPGQDSSAEQPTQVAVND